MRSVYVSFLAGKSSQQKTSFVPGIACYMHISKISLNEGSPRVRFLERPSLICKVFFRKFTYLVNISRDMWQKSTPRKCDCQNYGGIVGKKRRPMRQRIVCATWDPCCIQRGLDTTFAHKTPVILTPLLYTKGSGHDFCL